MEVEISKVTHETVKLSDQQVEDIVVKYLQKQLFPAEWIDGNNDLKANDPDHWHGSITEINYGIANAVQMAAWEMLKRIRENQVAARKLKECAQACRQ